jgi:alpha-acetolactate decarboxylase
MSKTAFEQIRGELISADGKTYNVQLDLSIKELMVDELTRPVDRAITRIALSRMSSASIPNDTYTLTYIFNAKKHTDRVRIEGGTMLAG